MSEALSSGEIEDVLSSIRRLVSDDLRPASRAVAPSDASPSGLAQGDVKPVPPVKPAPEAKLILTPSLRVVPVEEAASSRLAAGGVGQLQGAGVAAHQVAAGAGDGSVLPPDPDRAPAVIVLPANILPTDPQPLRAASSSMPDSDVWAGGAEDAPPENPVLSNTHPEVPDHPAQVDSADSDARLTLTRLVSSIGSAVEDPSGEWEPELDIADFPEPVWRALDWVDEAEVLPLGTDPVKPATKSAGVAETDAPASNRNAAAFEESPLQFRSRKASTDTQNDRAEAEAVAEILRAKAAIDADDGLFANEGGVFDEAVLRDLVRDLIREELSGALGERITRNVRKLVRAELNRVMTSREFD